MPEPFLPFRTERLLVRAFAAADVPSFARYRNDPNVARYQDWPLPYAEEVAQRLVDSQLGIDGPVAGEWVQLALELDGELAGDVAVGLDEHASVATLGYTLRPEHQGRGLGREAVAALIDRLFQRCGVHRVQASVDPANTASIRLLEALGFAHEGLSRRAVLVRGEWADDDRWALLADEWASPNRPME